MDDNNVAALRQICPPEQRDKIRLLMEFGRDGRRDDSRVVVDPYFGGDEGFERYSTSAKPPAKACSQRCARN